MFTLMKNPDKEKQGSGPGLNQVTEQIEWDISNTASLNRKNIEGPHVATFKRPAASRLAIIEEDPLKAAVFEADLDA